MLGSTFIRLFQDIYCIPCKTKQTDNTHTHTHTKSKPFSSASVFYTTEDAFYDHFWTILYKIKKINTKFNIMHS